MPTELTAQERKAKEDQNDNRDENDATRYPEKKKHAGYDPNKNITCPKCFKLFFNNKNVKRHMITQHHGTRRLQCPDYEKKLCFINSMQHLIIIIRNVILTKSEELIAVLVGKTFLILLRWERTVVINTSLWLDIIVMSALKLSLANPTLIGI